MSKKDSIIRVRDRVQIINPKIVERVGYDNNLKSVANQIVEKHADRIAKFIKGIELDHPPDKSIDLFADNVDKRAIAMVAAGIAYEIVGNRIRSGARRQIFYSKEEPPVNFLPGSVVEVTQVKIVKTGTYYAPSSGGGYDPWSGEYDYDYEPGGLNNEKTHKLIEMDDHSWIEACNVEKVYE